MSRARNMRALDFAIRELFEAEPDEGFEVASILLSDLADRYCAFEMCQDSPDGRSCRRHARAITVGVSKLIADGQVLGELTRSGRYYVRLSRGGVQELMGRQRIPGWVYERPSVLDWAGVL